MDAFRRRQPGGQHGDPAVGRRDVRGRGARRPGGSTLAGFGSVVGVLPDGRGESGRRRVLAFSGTGDEFYGSLRGTEIDFAGGTDLLGLGANLTAARVVAVSGGAVVTLETNVDSALSVSAATLAVEPGGGFSLDGPVTFGASATLTGREP